MAETEPTKRRRGEEEEERRQQEESDQPSPANPKRHKPHNPDNLNLLGDDEQEQNRNDQITLDPSKDLSSPFVASSLHQELTPTTVPEVAAPPCSKATTGGGEEDAESVMRRLLEASDDELGIPNRGDHHGDTDNAHRVLDSAENLAFDFDEYDHLWELEDEAANYYDVLQSQLFM